jgi:hypothetical protein
VPPDGYHAAIAAVTDAIDGRGVVRAMLWVMEHDPMPDLDPADDPENCFDNVAAVDADDNLMWVFEDGRLVGKPRPDPEVDNDVVHFPDGPGGDREYTNFATGVNLNEHTPQPCWDEPTAMLAVGGAVVRIEPQAAPAPAPAPGG